MKILQFLLSTALGWDKTIRIFGGDANMKASYDIFPSDGNINGTLSSLPDKGRIYHSVIDYRGKIYLIGGQPGGKNGEAKSKPIGTVYTESFNGDWLTDSELIQPRARQATTIYDDKIWTCGGLGGKDFGTLKSCESYDGRSWTREPDMIGSPESGITKGRDRFALISTDQGMMAIGGKNSHTKSAQTSTEIFSTTVGRWLPGPRMPNERFGHSALAFQNKIFVFGGAIDESEAGILMLEKFDAQWSVIGQLLNPVRLKFIALKSGNEAFIYGGKCEKASNSDAPSWQACNPMAEIFNFETYQSAPFDSLRLPGNLEAGAIVVNPEAEPDVPSRQPERTMRAFRAELPDEFASLFAEELEENVPSGFQYDVMSSDAYDAELAFEEMEEDAMFESFDDIPFVPTTTFIPTTTSFTTTTTTTTTFTTTVGTTVATFATKMDAPLELDAPLEVFLETDRDLNKDGEVEVKLPEPVPIVKLPPTFNLSGNSTEIERNLIRRYGEPVNAQEMNKLVFALNSLPASNQNVMVTEEFGTVMGAARRLTINGEGIIFARSSFQCWTCNEKNEDNCRLYGGPEICSEDAQSCMIYSEQQNGRSVAFRSGCSNQKVCLTQRRQNYMGTSIRSHFKQRFQNARKLTDKNTDENTRANQCRPGARWGSSTCNHCCLTSLCNDMVSFDGDSFDWES